MVKAGTVSKELPLVKQNILQHVIVIFNRCVFNIFTRVDPKVTERALWLVELQY